MRDSRDATERNKEQKTMYDYDADVVGYDFFKN